MSSPTFSHALSYVVDAQAEILSAVADWKSDADPAAEAYSQAYEDQGRVLGSVNKRLEEMRKEDAERMTLALTILRVGVAEPIRVCPRERQGREGLRKASGKSAGQGFEDGPGSGGRDG